MTGAELKAWVSHIPDDFSVEFESLTHCLELGSLRISPFTQSAIQFISQGNPLGPDMDAEPDDPTEPDTLANLGMCQADFR